MNKDPQKSLFYILGLILTTVVIAVMTILLTYNYYYTKAENIEEFNTNAQITQTRLKNSIAPFIESYSVNEYEKLIDNEMNNKNIYAVVVEDFLSGDILGKKILYSGKIRDDNWQIELYKAENELQQEALKHSYLVLSSDVFSLEGAKIGKVNIYYTNKYLKKHLLTLIEKSIFITFVVSLLLIFFLFISINKNILTPIEKIVQALLDRGSDGLPAKALPNKGSKEIQDLSETMNEIIDTTRASKQKIIELNERFELTLNAVQDGIWDWDILSDETYFSKSWKEMLGYADHEIENLGKSFFNLVHSNDKEKVYMAMDKHFKNPDIYDYNLEIRLRCKSGAYKWIQSRGKAILDEKSNPVRMLGYHSDITEQKKNKAYQEQQEKILTDQSRLASMGEMIGNIAHQWRQPLSIISTGITGMKLKKEYDALEDEIFFETCEIINDNVQYLSKTIDDFRDFIKGNKQRAVFNLSDTINSLLRILKGSIQNHNIGVRVDLDESVVINGYENQLLQCIINIFNNAKDAMKDNKKKIISIKTKKEGEKAIIEIKDNAGGIKPEVMPHIFEPYFTTKPKEQGTGLGLHMTHNLIVNGMQGQIKAVNISFEEKGVTYKGIIMKITLPLDK